MWDVEDLVARGEEMRGCPYFASRDELVGANLVLCPYNYLVDPAIRASMDINLKDSVRLPAPHCVSSHFSHVASTFT